MIIYGFWFYEELRDKVGKRPACHRGDSEDSYMWLHTAYASYMAKTSSFRLELFRQNPKCVTCYRTGKLWILESHRKKDTPHLNLYHVEVNRGSSDGLTMMTKDHIIPKSAGGPTNLSNLQTMCTVCNNSKGSLLPHELPLPLNVAIMERLGEKKLSKMDCLNGMAHYV